MIKGTALRIIRGAVLTEGRDKRYDPVSVCGGAGVFCRAGTGSDRVRSRYPAHDVLPVLLQHGTVFRHVPALVRSPVYFHRLAVPAFCPFPDVHPSAGLLLSGFIVFHRLRIILYNLFNGCPERALIIHGF